MHASVPCSISKLKNANNIALTSSSPFAVDARLAGSGKVDVYMRLANKKVPIRLTETQNYLHKVFFMPRVEGRHMVTITFNGEVIPGKHYHDLKTKPKKYMMVSCNS